MMSDELFNGAAAVNETVAGMEFAANALVIAVPFSFLFILFFFFVLFLINK